MNKLILTILIGILSLNISYSQDQEKYGESVREASALYDSKDYMASSLKYKEAFDHLGGKAYPNDRYNAACSYALAEDVENAFYHLYYLAENPNIKYRNYNHITVDTDLKILYKDERWDKLLTIVKANKDNYEKDFDQELVRTLDTIYQLDQSYRMQIDAIEEEYGRESEEMKAHWQVINETDSINLIKVTNILDEKGWLGANVIGGQGNTTLFLVIQHADMETQIKYLPMMREAVAAGNARGSSLALLEDRVALRQGNRQIYGSQIGRDKESGEYYVSPLVDPENVNERRAEVGLGPIEDYVGRWDVIWDVEKHKVRTAKIEAEEK